MPASNGFCPRCRHWIDARGITMMDLTLSIILGIAALEGMAFALVIWLRQDCAWLITRRDLTPEIDPGGLDAFLEHGWDKELGWVRKPNTRSDETGRKRARTSYSLDATGARSNPGFGDQPPAILAYGDSYTFSREVNDREAWPHRLSEILGVNAANHGVGNYGLDQALLRLEREFDAHPAPIILMGVVPEAISRILSVWKHFSEYGNTFGFKPRFVLEDGDLKLLPNPVDDADKFFRIADLFDRLAADDYFFEAKFSKDLLHFPFLWTLGRSWKRSLPLLSAALTDRLGLTTEQAFVRVMERNIDLASGLYRDPGATQLFKAICRRFIRFARDRGAEPILVMMPQLLDLEHIRNGDDYYKPVLDQLAGEMTVVDLAPALLENNDLDALFIHDRYGGHLSVTGNLVVASVLAPVCRRFLEATDGQPALDATAGRT